MLTRMIAAAYAPVLIGGVLMGGALCGGAMAQQDDANYPQREVRIAVAAAPGGNPDVLVRLLCAKLTTYFGKSFLVENITGAGGTLAANNAAKASDAYSLTAADSGALSIAPWLYSKLPYDPTKDFTFVTSLAIVPTVLVAQPSLPAETMAEFIAYAKARPGQLNFGSAGPGSIHHLTMAVFVQRAGIQTTFVPYRAGALITQGLLAGEAHVAFNGIPNVLEQLNSKKLKAFAISTPERFKGMPDLPTVAEQGFPGFDINTNMGLVARAGTSPAIVAKLQQAVAKALREPDVVERMNFLGMQLTEAGTAAFEERFKSEYVRYRQVIQENNIKIE